MANSQLSYAPDQDIHVRSMSIAPNSEHNQLVALPYTWSGAGGASTASLRFVRMGDYVTVSLTSDVLLDIGNAGIAETGTPIPAAFRPTIGQWNLWWAHSGGTEVVGGLHVYPNGITAFTAAGGVAFVANAAATGPESYSSTYYVG